MTATARRVSRESPAQSPAVDMQSPRVFRVKRCELGARPRFQKRTHVFVILRPRRKLPTAGNLTQLQPAISSIELLRERVNASLITSLSSLRTSAIVFTLKGSSETKINASITAARSAWLCGADNVHRRRRLHLGRRCICSASATIAASSRLASSFSAASSSVLLVY